MPTKTRPPTQNRPNSLLGVRRLVSQAGLAKHLGVARSTVSRAAKPGGALHPAMVRDRVDLDHPACVAWAPKKAFEPELIEAPTEPEPEPEVEQHSGYCGGCGALHSAYVGTPIEEFAQRAEAPVRVVRAALANELAPALRDDGQIDIAHPASLAFLARSPIDQDDEKAPLPVNGHDFLCPASLDEDGHVDVEHPILFAFIARWIGRVPQPSDVDEFFVEFHDWIPPVIRT